MLLLLLLFLISLFLRFMKSVFNAFFWNSFELRLKNYLNYKQLTWNVLQPVLTLQKGKVVQGLRAAPTSN